jgi:hypothetical protein
MRFVSGLPTGWVAGALAAAVIVLLAAFLLRPRPRAVFVPSAVLWRRVIPNTRAARWREWLLLAMQLATVGALAIAALDPRDAPSEESEFPLIAWVIDRSMSMGAAGRLDRVRNELGAALALLPSKQPLVLVAAGETPELLAGPGLDRARSALAIRLLQATPEVADSARAVAFASALGASTIELWTDDPAAAALPVRVRAPFVSAPNLAIEAFSVRASDGIPAEHELLVRVANHGDQPSVAELIVETEDALLGAATLRIEASQHVVRRYRFEPLPAARVTARLADARWEGVDAVDTLATDDVATTFIEPLRPIRVEIAGEPDRFLERALALLPGVQLTRAARHVPGDWDLVLFDRYRHAEPSWPDRAVWFDPAPGASPFRAVGVLDAPTLTDWNLDHPLSKGLVLRDLNIRRSQVFAPEAGEVRLLGAPAGPLALARSSGDKRQAVFGFDPAQSDWPLRLAFPQTVANLVLWMREGRAVGPAAGEVVRAGDAMWLDGGEEGGNTTLVDLPSGVPKALALGRGPTPFRLPGGVFGTVDARTVAANTLDTAESELRSLPPDAGPAPPPAPNPPPVERSPPWLALALAAALLAVVEFVAWTR